MLYDHLSAHSFLAKLGGNKIHKKDNIKIGPEVERSAGKGLDSQLCHYQELQTRKQAGSSLPGG